MDNKHLYDRIIDAKVKLGKRLVILGHHYQREEVIKFADFKGDSFGLSKRASETSAEFIVFCGVHFMAEAARILARPEQKVFHPDFNAGCPMSDMADIEEVERAWDVIARPPQADEAIQRTGLLPPFKTRNETKVIPIAYMNTSAEIKAFCGRNGGIICTSSNAPKAFEWAFKQGGKVFFFPDEHLGRNTARIKGIASDQIAMWRDLLPQKQSGALDCFGSRLAMTRVILWPGYCHVHTHFTPEHIKEARAKYPGCRIIVHPECREEVVMASDESGSTERICRYVEAQPKGAVIVIGTEINLVSRLAHENSEKVVVPLARSLCPNMFRISPQKLLETLEGILAGDFKNEVVLPQEIVGEARVALERMLAIA